MKVMTIVGTRPELIRLSRVLVKLDLHFESTLVHTGQNYDYQLNKIFFDEMQIPKPDYFLECAKNSSSPANTIGNILIEVDKILSTVKPDALLILGDTNSALSAIPAKRHQIPVFHMEAGNRCFDERVPEEINRKIVDHISDINLPYSQIARDYLISEGIPRDQIIKTGSPMREVLSFYSKQIDKSTILEKFGLKNKEYFLLSSHREENIENSESFLKLVDLIEFLDRKFNMPVIISTHPRTRKKIIDNNITFSDNVKLLDPLGFFDYVFLQKNAKTVLSDSGTITEESAILGFPALNIRYNHERPEGMEKASVMMVGLDISRIQEGLNFLQINSIQNSDISVDDYDDISISNKIVKIIISYTDYINKKVWHK